MGYNCSEYNNPPDISETFALYFYNSSVIRTGINSNSTQ